MRVVIKEMLLMKSLQQWKQRKLNLDFSGMIVHRDYSSEEITASHLSESPTGQTRLMESILERNNMRRAIKRVIKNE
jgi:hypothetical protein